MKSILIIISFVFYSIFAKSQSELSGYVTDKTNSKPIVGVNIYIPEIGKGTITDDNGFYTMTQLPEGHFHVQFSFIGYSTRVEHIIISNAPSQLDIKLDQIEIQSQEVVVSGGSYMSQHENAIKIETINPHEIAQLNGLSFGQTLSSVPGVDLISKGPGISTPVIRGLSLSNVLVLNNGIRLENYQFSENHPLMIDEYGVDKIEIIKGPASLLYGSDAIGGVINVISEKNAVSGEIKGDVNMAYFSNTNGYHGSFGVRGAKNNVFYGVRAGIKTHEDYKDGNAVVVPNSRFNEYSAKVTTGIIKPYGKMAVYYDYNRMKMGMTIDESIPLIENNSRKNEYWFQDLTNHMITLKNSAFLNQFKINLNLSYQMNTRKLQESVIDPKITEVHMQLNTFFYELKVYFPTNEKVDFIIGLQGRNIQNRNFEAYSHVLPDYTNNDFSIYGLYQQNFTSKIHFQTGLRYDLRDVYVPEQEKTSHDHGAQVEEPADLMPELKKDFSNVSGSVGATFDLNEHLLFRANFASAFRTPNIAEMTQDGMHGNRYEQGDRSLKSQRSNEFDLSVHYHSKYISFDLAGFYNRVNNYIFLTPTSDTTDDGDDIYRYTQDNAHLYGFESGINIKSLTILQFMISYAYLVGESIDGEPLPFIPHNKLNSSISLEFDKFMFLKKLNFVTKLCYAFEQNNPSMFESYTPDYFVLDASFGFAIPLFNQEIKLNFSASNLLDTKFFDHLSTLKNLNYYNMGRNFSFSVSIPFGN